MLNWAIRYQPVVHALDELAPRDVLDVGSGLYGLSWFRAGPVVQTDLDFAGRPPSDDRPGSPQYVCASVEHLPFGDSTFDAVISLDMMEHLAPQLRVAAMTEIGRVARRAIIVGFPLGRAARAADAAVLGGLRLARRDAPNWLREHRQQDAYPDRNTVPDAVPAGWQVTEVRRSGNALALATVHLAENLLGRPHNQWMPGRDRRWSWPRLLDAPPAYRRIYVLQRVAISNPLSLWQSPLMSFRRTMGPFYRRAIDAEVAVRQHRRAWRRRRSQRSVLIENYERRLAEQPPRDFLVTVIIPTHKRVDMLREAIASVRASRHPHRQIIVVNDGPRGMLDGVDLGSPVEVAETAKQGSGPGAARNVGLKAARGAAAVFLDDDNLMQPYWLSAVAETFQIEPSLRWLYGARTVEEEYVLGRGFSGHAPFLDFPPYSLRELRRENYVDANIVAVRLPDHHAHFSEEFPGFEDWDLALRLAGQTRPREVPIIAVLYRTRHENRMSRGNREAEDRLAQHHGLTRRHRAARRRTATTS